MAEAATRCDATGARSGIGAAHGPEPSAGVVSYAQVKGHPCQALCKRVLRHEDERFPFVLVAGLRADNNQAERSIRPLVLVVIRNISGGSRSDAGTKTRMALASLLARGLNTVQECLRALGVPTSYPA